MNREDPQAGFSLLESVVAVAILGLALPLMFESVRSAVSLMSTTERREAEWRIAENLMTEATATLDGKEGTREGIDGGLAWRVETTFAGKDADGGLVGEIGDNLFRVRVMVRPAGISALESPVTLDTLRFRVTSR